MRRLGLLFLMVLGCQDLASVTRPATVKFSAPSAAKSGEEVTVSFDIKDTSKGQSYQLCAIAPSGAERCADVPGSSVSVRLDEPGEWKLEARCDFFNGRKEDGFRMVAARRVRVE